MQNKQENRTVVAPRPAKSTAAGEAPSVTVCLRKCAGGGLRYLRAAGGPSRTRVGSNLSRSCSSLESGRQAPAGVSSSVAWATRVRGLTICEVGRQEGSDGVRGVRRFA